MLAKLAHCCTKIYRLLLPFHCILCKTQLQDAQHDLCTLCYLDLPKLPPNICNHCAGATAPKLLGHSTTTCSFCLAEQPHFSTIYSLFHYVPPITTIIRKLTQQYELAYASIFGSLLATTLPKLYQHNPWPDLLLPYPSDIVNLKQYGYHPPAELAQILKHHLGINIAKPVISTLDYYTTNSAAKLSLYGKHIALIDTVINTGTRCNNFSKILLTHGAHRVDVWCVART